MAIVNRKGEVFDVIPETKLRNSVDGWIDKDIFYLRDITETKIINLSGNITKIFFDEEYELLDIINDSNGLFYWISKKDDKQVGWKRNIY